MVAITSWGRLVQAEHAITPLADRVGAGTAIRHATPGLAHGMGRSYGDACLNPGGALWLTRGLDRFISFDPDSGRLACEAGVLLRDIQRLAVPRGWMLPVTPGTQLATVGGAVANDVHGKNHHVVGSFGDQVTRLTLLRTDGDVIECGPDTRPDWFAATVGGIGLTGLVTAAEIQLRRVAGPWLESETLVYRSLEEFLALADASEADWEHTVSWIDCLSGGHRGLFMRARHAEGADGPPPKGGAKRMPLTPPVSLVNGLSLRAFNAAYFRMNARKKGRARVHYEPFFYPLDNLLEWNRMYGPRGFYQYQCVIPREQGRVALQAILDEIARSGNGSFLAVLKTFGNRSSLGMLGFPRPGITLALDFPNKGLPTERLFARLDAVVGEARGCLYLAKDARMPRSLFEAGYPRLPQFLPYRDPGISSAMSRRLMGY
ncbi:glycolate oxidase subunit [Bordetella ansorpii]|uniref:Glycolate oxidase subunit n=1 Tax=Bordetella ansorpii TaxID=288768 RepID=A0A157S9L2_9BORD|nr:FAD-binding oxidoreductase [Bordetella ansorpii]SAI67112.1 glycolate oxidase subunit [Bordetella ansorpii]